MQTKMIAVAVAASLVSAKPAFSQRLACEQLGTIIGDQLSLLSHEALTIGHGTQALAEKYPEAKEDIEQLFEDYQAALMIRIDALNAAMAAQTACK